MNEKLERLKELAESGNGCIVVTPETIKALIAELEAKEAEVEALKELVCNFSLTGIDEVNRETYFALRDGKTGDA